MFDIFNKLLVCRDICEIEHFFLQSKFRKFFEQIDEESRVTKHMRLINWNDLIIREFSISGPPTASRAIEYADSL